jgi:hypothetical protein
MPFSPAQLQSFLPCLHVAPVRCCVPLPGGGQICGFSDSLDPWKMLQPYIQALMATLNPFMPVFRILAVLLALVDCIKAIPQSILPPNPGPIINCLQKLISAVVEVIKLIPFITLPFTLVAILDCVILFLTALRNTLQLIIVRFTQLNIALQNPALAFGAQCELDLLSVQIGSINSILVALGILFGVVNLFLGLIGLDGIPTSLSVDLSEDVEVVLEPLNETISALQLVRSFIPIG